MGFANLCLRRSASRLASSLCGGRVRSISTVVNRLSLVYNPSLPLRPFVVSRYSTAATDNDWISSEQAVLRAIDSEYSYMHDVRSKKDVLDAFIFSLWTNRSIGTTTLPASFPFKVEDIPGNRTLTLTREYNGEHIKVLVGMPLYSEDGHPSNGSNGDDNDAPSNESNDDALSNGSNNDAPSNESNDTPNIESKYDDDDDAPEDIDERCMYIYPLVVTVTKKSGRSLELRCRASIDGLTVDDVHVNLPGHSSEDPKVILDINDTVGMSHTDVKENFRKYLKIRGLEESTIETIDTYMSNKLKQEYWLWLDYVKEFLEE